MSQQQQNECEICGKNMTEENTRYVEDSDTIIMCSGCAGDEEEETKPKLCWTCDEKVGTHKEFRDALGEEELTCDDCHREEYPEKYEEEVVDCVCGNNQEKGLVDGVMRCEDCDIDGKNYEEETTPFIPQKWSINETQKEVVVQCWTCSEIYVDRQCNNDCVSMDGDYWVENKKCFKCERGGEEDKTECCKSCEQTDIEICFDCGECADPSLPNRCCECEEEKICSLCEGIIGGDDDDINCNCGNEVEEEPQRVFETDQDYKFRKELGCIKCGTTEKLRDYHLSAVGKTGIVKTCFPCGRIMTKEEKPMESRQRVGKLTNWNAKPTDGEPVGLRDWVP